MEIINNVQNDKAVTPAMVQGVRAQVAPRLAANAQLAAPGAAAQVGEEMKLQSVIVQAGWLAAIKENKLPTYRQGIATQFKTQYGLDLSQLKLTPQGFAGKAAPVAATKPVQEAATAASMAPAGSGAAVTTAGAQWFFRAVSGVGAAISFEPVVLLAGGQYFDIGSEPLENVNVAAAKAARPAAWGTWRKNGAAFVLTNY